MANENKIKEDTDRSPRKVDLEQGLSLMTTTRRFSKIECPRSGDGQKYRSSVSLVYIIKKNQTTSKFVVMAVAVKSIE